MANDLVFDKAPLGGPPNVLVFGEPDAVPSGAAYALGRIALPTFAVAGAASATRPPAVRAGGSIALPAFALGGTLRYDSAVQRPLVGRVQTAWQLAVPIESGITAAHQAVTPLRAASRSRWQRAAPASAGAALRWQDGDRLRVGAAARHQEAVRLARGAALPWQDVERVRTGGVSRWQEAARLSPVAWALRYQDVNRMRTESHVRWQSAVLRQLRRGEPVQSSQRLLAGLRSRWQEFMRPPAGASVLVPPTKEPCYVPSTALVFGEKQAYSTTLIFICERHSPPPGGGQTVVVPILEVYSVENEISLVRVDGGDAIAAKDFAMSLDADSWTWQWSATIPASALPLITPDSSGDPVAVQATINGVPYRLAAERYRRDRRFSSAEVRVQGRGRAAILDAPYAPVLNHTSTSGRSAAQLLELALTINGVGNGWAVDPQFIDWFVPGGTWDFQGTPIAAVLEIAAAAGAIVQPHATDATLRVLPRYPAAPWRWNTLTPDVELPADVVEVEGIEWITQPDYNRVFVFGSTSAAARGQITRSGTAGDNVAPQIVHALMTHSDAVLQRGLAELSNTGRQANVSLNLQVLPETGIIVPNTVLRYDDGEKVRTGIVRGTALQESWPTLRQSLTVETHEEA